MPTWRVLLGGAALVLSLVSCRQSSRQVAEEARLRRARAAQDDLKAAGERKANDADRARRHAENIARARQLLDSPGPMLRCEAALDLGAAGAREAIPALLAMLERVGEDASVRNCAAEALVKLGELDRPLAFFCALARAGTSDGRRIAIGGFGEIGARAASAALPFLAEALKSDDFAERYIAVDSLAHLGPLAAPLLREAERDADQRVRQRAAAALASLPH